MTFRLHDNTEQKFNEIFYAYKDKLYGYILGLTHSEQEAEDAVQNVFMRLWQNRERLNEIDNVNAYLFRTAQNDIIDASRKFVHRQKYLSEMLSDDMSTDNPLKIILKEEIENKLKEAIDQLTNRQRQIFMMRKKMGMNHADIAKQLNISVETAESTMKRALKSVRTYLMTHYPELMMLVAAFIIS